MAKTGDQEPFRIEDFRDGIDVRRSILASPKHSVRVMTNCVLNQGAEIEQRRAFVSVMAALPAHIHGVIGQGGKLHYFSDTPAAVLPPCTGPNPAVLHELAPAGLTIQRMMDCDVYNGKFYFIGQMADGTYRHWYDGVLLNQTTPAGTRSGTFVRMIGTKAYWTDGPLLRFSDVDSPATDGDTTALPGGGFIDVSKQDSDAEDVISIEAYYSYAAVFSRLMTQIWTLDPNPANNALFQKLRVGTVAPLTPFQFGTGDVLFLADSGIRSLRAINYTLAASLVDVGSPIDDLVVANIAADPYLGARAVAIVQPVYGRYWCAIGGTVYVLSYFPSSKISAWSIFAPGFQVGHLARVDNFVYALADDTRQTYLYGGNTGNVYDACPVEIITPMYSAESPEQWKGVDYIEANLEGTWLVEGGMLANNPNARETIATLTQQTYSEQRIPFDGYGTHIGLRFSRTALGPAKLGAITIGVRFGST